MEINHNVLLFLLVLIPSPILTDKILTEETLASILDSFRAFPGLSLFPA